MDPQVGECPTASVVAAAQKAKGPDDKTLILAEVSRKALRQVQDFVAQLLERRMEPEQAREVAPYPRLRGVDARPPPLNPKSSRGSGCR